MCVVSPFSRESLALQWRLFGTAANDRYVNDRRRPPDDVSGSVFVPTPPLRQATHSPSMRSIAVFRFHHPPSNLMDVMYTCVWMCVRACCRYVTHGYMRTEPRERDSIDISSEVSRFPYPPPRAQSMPHGPERARRPMTDKKPPHPTLSLSLYLSLCPVCAACGWRRTLPVTGDPRRTVRFVSTITSVEGFVVIAGRGRMVRNGCGTKM